MDLIQRLDASKLVVVNTLLSFGLSLFTAPPYNLPLFLFGTYLQENVEAIRSLQTFTFLLGLSALFDILWMIKNEQSSFIKFLTIILMLLKIPTFFVFARVLSERHGHFGLSHFDSAGATVWSMPGGLATSERDGYQPVDDERPPSTNNPKPIVNPATRASQPVPPGAYQV